MSARAIKIAVMALGGQGGGVLASWIVKAGERAGFLAQSTSVPGVAQRTGATIYYVELFPVAEAQKRGAAPVLALMPAPGDVDILLAAEMMEAGRALARDFLSEKTVLISSTHRVYAVGEKIVMGDGRQDADPLRAAVERAAGRCIWLDMEKLAEEAGAVISAVMLGALAGSGATPLPRSVFEETIRESGRAVEKSLNGFALGFHAAASTPAAAPAAEGVAARPPMRPSPAVKPLVDRLQSLPDAARETALLGLKKVVDHQDARAGADYLDKVERFTRLETGIGDARSTSLTKAVAKYLALAMAYEDVIRVADLKTRASRFRRFREDVRAADEQIVRVFEYMHPRLEEVCDLLPPSLARSLLRSRNARHAFDAVLGKGRRVATTDIAGFLMLQLLASLKFLRRSGYRYQAEQARIGKWLDLIEQTAREDYALACEIARLQRLIKGYGETHARGIANYSTILSALDRVRAADEPARALARLKDAALKDEEGAALKTALAALKDAPSLAA